MKIAGNTFDYPFVHGKAIQAAGNYSFVSCSDEAVENGRIQPEHYPIVDFILGLEKDDILSNPARKTYYKTFSSPMQRDINRLLSVRRKPSRQRVLHWQRHE